MTRKIQTLVPKMKPKSLTIAPQPRLSERIFVEVSFVFLHILFLEEGKRPFVSFVVENQHCKREGFFVAQDPPRGI